MVRPTENASAAPSDLYRVVSIEGTLRACRICAALRLPHGVNRERALASEPERKKSSVAFASPLAQFSREYVGSECAIEWEDPRN